MTRIIPGVQVQVVKEVLPPQLTPSGVLGLVGLSENEVDHVVRASSLSRFVEILGPGTAVSMPEARQALANGVFELVVSPVNSTSAQPPQTKLSCKLIIPAKKPNNAEITLPYPDLVTLFARVKGTWANGSALHLKSRQTAVETVLDLKIGEPGGSTEVHRNLTFTPGTSRYIAEVLEKESSLIKAGFNWQWEIINIDNKEIDATAPTTLLKLKTKDNALKQVELKLKSDDKKDPEVHLSVALTKNAKNDNQIDTLTITRQKGEKKEEVLKLEKIIFPKDLHKLMTNLNKIEGCEVIFPKVWLDVDEAALAAGTNITLDSGKDASNDDYLGALQRLENEPDVDMVLAAVQDFSKPAGPGDEKPEAAQIYSAVIGHCEIMSADCQGRIGFGQVGPKFTIEECTELAQKLISDRFALIAPHGVIGAVAGMIGSLQYFQSPTFKRLSGISKLSTNLDVEDQRTLLKSHLVPVVSQRERGIIVLHGLTTDGDQVSVRRTADRAVRGTKAISELFIGRLNNEDGRGALKQKLAEFLIQMEKEGAIVPSTDGTDPAYKIDVYSSQDDFAKGIVRVDLAVRPVRAIDYIYATILVQV